LSFSIIIPSRNIDNLIPCVAAIRAAGETARIIVAWDGDSTDWARDDNRFRGLLADGNLQTIEGVQPFVFARNVNIGIQQAGTDDVVIMNDDALLETPQGLTELALDASQHPEYGVIAASVDSCGTPNQNHCSAKNGLREERVMLAFICVYIPRHVLTVIGLLDEAFAVNAGGAGPRGYGCEDDDFCWRARAAGYKLGVENDVFVSHTKLPSTFRADPEHPADVKIHERLFEQKWGRHPRRPF
jgi:GT2 family glycosyltransferase